MPKIALVGTWIVLFFYCSMSLAQIEPRFVNVVDNSVLINPSLSGATNDLRFTLLNHQQWVGPAYQLNSTYGMYDMAFNHESMGVALVYSNWKTTGAHQQRIKLAYSYKLRIGKSRLAAGAGFGLEQNKMQYDYFTARDNDDPSKVTGLNVWGKTVDVGISLNSNKYLLAASLTQAVDANSFGVKRKGFLLAKYKVNVVDKVFFIPSLMVRTQTEFMSVIYLGGSFRFQEICWVGMQYISSGELAFQCGAHLNQIIKTINHQVKVGYAYQLGVSNFAVNSGGSHEVFLVLGLRPRPKTENILKRKMIISPQLLY